jgi:hypothetical protein
MDYFFWVNGYENAGIVKANNIEEAKQKVILSQGKCKNITLLDNEQFDKYDVAILIA